MSNVLIVLSAAETWTRADGTEYPTGYWAEEFVVIHEKFVAAGATVDIATPAGQPPTADPHSLDPDVAGPEVPRFVAYLDAIAGTLEAPLDLAEVSVADYDAVVVPGGRRAVRAGPDQLGVLRRPRRASDHRAEPRIERGHGRRRPRRAQRARAHEPRDAVTFSGTEREIAPAHLTDSRVLGRQLTACRRRRSLKRPGNVGLNNPAPG